MPFVALMFFINYLDRTAIGFAAPNGMEADLALSAAQFGFASGVFFIGYILLEVPSNLALHRFGARKWIARIMISWGIVASAMAFVPNGTVLIALRFLLGVAEAGFFPGIILYLTYWYPERERARIVALDPRIEPAAADFDALEAYEPGARLDADHEQARAPELFVNGGEDPLLLEPEHRRIGVPVGRERRARVERRP